MSLIKEKMSQYKIDEEIKHLTLVLELETITHAVTKFPSTTESMVLQCRKLMKKKRSEETVVLVKHSSQKVFIPLLS